jgi:hypothetical protein
MTLISGLLSPKLSNMTLKPKPMSLNWGTIMSFFSFFLLCIVQNTIFVYFVNLFIFIVVIVRVMLVGWGGNNGSTLTGGVIANRELVSSYSSFFD